MDLDGPALRRLADLTVTLERECRLIDELHRAVLRQRDAVSRGDAPAVEASIRAAGRALLTLQETRRSRAVLLESLVGNPTQPLSSLETHFEAGLPESFLVLCREVHRSATAVAQAVWRNQEVLMQALKARDTMVQELLTGSPPASHSAPPGELTGETAPASLTAEIRKPRERS